MSDTNRFDPREYFGLEGNRHMADTDEEYVCKRLGISADTLYHSIEKAGLSCLRLNADDGEERQHCARENWLYVYDKKDLQGFLDRNNKILTKAGWPTQADNFVLHTSYVTAPANSAMFDLIHVCYGGDSLRGDNGWLRVNSDKTPKNEIAYQREGAEDSRQRFKAFRENDPEAAVYLLNKAATGRVDLMYDVSRMYERGRGFKQDKTEAAFWFGLAEEKMRGKWVQPIDAYPWRPNATPDFQLTEAQEAAVQKRFASWKPEEPVRQRRSISTAFKKTLHRVRTRQDHSRPRA